jgi:hypothetical protein
MASFWRNKFVADNSFDHRKENQHGHYFGLWYSWFLGSQTKLLAGEGGVLEHTTFIIISSS